jgi:ferrous iron transport protein A
MNAKSLDTIKAGEKILVLRITGGRHAREKLTGMGIVPGEKIKVSKNDGSGPLIVDIYGSRTVIGIGLAQKVMVTELGDEFADSRGGSDPP